MFYGGVALYSKVPDQFYAGFFTALGYLIVEANFLNKFFVVGYNQGLFAKLGSFAAILGNTPGTRNYSEGRK